MKQLPYPVLLGRDVPAFKEAIATSAPSDDVFTPTLVPAMDPRGPPMAEPGSSQVSHEGRLETLLQDPTQLGEAQAQDATLEALRQMTLVSDGRVVDERQAG